MPFFHHGLFRVACAVPRVRVADAEANAAEMLKLLARAEEQGVGLTVFPELSLTGYTCGDLFHQQRLIDAALEALHWLSKEASKVYSGLYVLGLPRECNGMLFNAAVLLSPRGPVGMAAKSYLPNYKEFYEHRWFAPAVKQRLFHEPASDDGKHPLADPGQKWFRCSTVPDLGIGIEVCEDVWVPIPPSSSLALAGATVLVNLSASNDLIGKADYRRQLVASQSGRCVAAYLYVSSGVTESTTDLVFGGHAMIAENGVLLAESQRFARESSLLVADVDLQRLKQERLRLGSFSDAAYLGSLTLPPSVSFPLEGCEPEPLPLRRAIPAHPFVPHQADTLRERCEEIFQIQVAGLAKRLEHLGGGPLSLGVSGGLDSTLALLVACKTLDRLEQPRTRLLGITMPGFGTSRRTLANAHALMQQLGVSAKEIDIRASCLNEFRLLGHAPFGIDLQGLDLAGFEAKLQAVPSDRRHDLLFENVQARMRTQLLMNHGFVIGTGDLSELALGWCTFNADQMSMYNPNVSIPKTLVRFLVRWAAVHEFEEPARRVLLDVADTVISPELLPLGEGERPQATEHVIGPYELHDFFLFHFLRYGASPEKILFLAEQAAFDRKYASQELRQWLAVFLRRFFAQQYKRSTLPDGPKVGSISLSPRGDWRMPSDPVAEAWLRSLEKAQD